MHTSAYLYTQAQSLVTKAMLSEAVRISLTVDMELEQFDATRLRQLSQEIASSYGISEVRVQITNVRAASVQMDVLILGPPEGSGEPSAAAVVQQAVQQWSSAVANGQSGVAQLGPFRISDVSVDNDLSGSITQTPFQGKTQSPVQPM